MSAQGDRWRLEGEAKVPFIASGTIAPWSQREEEAVGVVLAVMLSPLEVFLEYYPP